MKLGSTVRMWRRCEYQEGADGSTINIFLSPTILCYFSSNLLPSIHLSILLRCKKLRGHFVFLLITWNMYLSVLTHVYFLFLKTLWVYINLFFVSLHAVQLICYINDVQTTEWLWLTRKVSDFINAVSGYVYITSPMIYVEMSFDVVQINKTGSPGFV